MSKTIQIPSQTEMLQAVGYAIQQFAYVELGLGFLYAGVMSPADRVACLVSLDAARHIETKLRIVRSVVDWGLTGDTKAEAVNLLNRTKNKADFRNKLAHHTVSLYPISKRYGPDIPIEFGVFLMPPISSPGSFTPTTPKITLGQIQEFANGCGDLFRAFIGFSNKLAPKTARKRPKRSSSVKSASKKSE